MKQLLLMTVCLMLAACNAASPAGPVGVQAPTPFPTDLIMKLERTACYGSCPIYRLTISGDGNVMYEGIDFVAVKGKQSATISREQVQQLITAFDQAQFFSLEDKYSVEVTDMPTTFTSMQMNGQTKRIEHYGFNDSDRDHVRLKTLEDTIDRVVNSKQWIGD